MSVEEIHKIREEHYEETKHLTSKEYIDNINEDAEKVRKIIEEKKKKKTKGNNKYAM